MPKVTRYGSREVEERAVSEAYLKGGATAEDFGALEGRALEGLGAKIGEVGKRLKKKNDTSDAYRALSKFKDAARVYRTDKFNKAGKDAVGATSLAMINYDDLVDNFGKELKGDSLALYERLALQAASGDKDKIAQHESQQVDVYKTYTLN